MIEYDIVDKVKAIRRLKYIIYSSKDEYNHTVWDFKHIDNEISKNIFKEIIDLYHYIDDLSIYQFSDFGFSIFYEICLGKNIIFVFNESSLPEKHDRKTMDNLILSELNRSRFRKNLNLRIKTLDEIEY